MKRENCVELKNSMRRTVRVDKKTSSSSSAATALVSVITNVKCSMVTFSQWNGHYRRLQVQWPSSGQTQQRKKEKKAHIHINHSSSSTSNERVLMARKYDVFCFFFLHFFLVVILLAGQLGWNSIQKLWIICMDDSFSIVLAMRCSGNCLII